MSKLRYSSTLFRDFVAFAREHKVYWIVPLVIVLGALVLLVVTGQVSAPFIYSIF